jgi:hypothetical protein
MIVNKPEEIDISEYENMIANTPYLSEFQSTSLREKANSATRKSSRSSIINMAPKKRVFAVGLRKALVLSTSNVEFKVPIKYYEKLKDGGFCEVKVTCFYLNFVKNLVI